MRNGNQSLSRPAWKRELRRIIFEADTPAGKMFDVVLMVSIALSVVIVILESVPSINDVHGPLLLAIEWFFTILFTIEYILRLIAVQRPLRYARSFFGVVDVLSILPTYVSLLIPVTHYLLVIRILRLLRIFRVLKLAEYLEEATILRRALAASQRKISVFLLAVVTLVVIIGTLMYVIEGEEHGFTSIPIGIYWAVVTLSTVGYGDVSPQTPLGKAFAVVVMLVGYGIIAVPTGIVTFELAQGVPRARITTRACPHCSGEGHDPDAL
jgi:voltage-gated potassium channel